MTHHGAASGLLCSSSSSPSCPLSLVTQTSVWRRRWTLGSGSDPLGLCWSGWWNSVCEKAPYLSVSEKCCSFSGTLRDLSPTSPIWLSKVQTARGIPQDWGGRTGSSAAWCVDVKPAHVQRGVTERLRRPGPTGWELAQDSWWVSSVRPASLDSMVLNIKRRRTPFLPSPK